MIDLHYWTTPNSHKITIFLEEAGLPYRIIPVNISKGDQFKPEFILRLVIDDSWNAVVW
jgi:GST-like protein